MHITVPALYVYVALALLAVLAAGYAARRVVLARRRAAAAGGIMSNFATGAEGITAPASTTGKSLLGQ